MDKVSLGNRVRQSRKKLYMTQEQLSEKADISVSFLGEIERAERSPSLDVLVSLANALGVTCDYLLRDSVETGSAYIDADISRKLSRLTHKQKVAAEAILDAYIKTL